MFIAQSSHAPFFHFCHCTNCALFPPHPNVWHWPPTLGRRSRGSVLWSEAGMFDSPLYFPNVDATYIRISRVLYIAGTISERLIRSPPRIRANATPRAYIEPNVELFLCLSLPVSVCLSILLSVVITVLRTYLLPASLSSVPNSSTYITPRSKRIDNAHMHTRGRVHA